MSVPGDCTSGIPESFSRFGLDQSGPEVGVRRRDGGANLSPLHRTLPGFRKGNQINRMDWACQRPHSRAVMEITPLKLITKELSQH